MNHRALWMLPLLLALPAFAQDADGDGLTDETEERLGSDPAVQDTLTEVLDSGEIPEARRKDGYDPALDVLKVSCGHAGGNRYLWRVEFAAAPQLDHTVLHLYVDADDDRSTGRTGAENAPTTGVDHMLTLVGGNASPSTFNADGSRGSSPALSSAVVGNAVYLTADVDLKRTAEGAVYELYVLCHATTEPGQQPTMSDSVARRKVGPLPVSDRPKIKRLTDYTESVQITATYGLDILRSLLAAKSTVEVRYDALELDGFEVDQFDDRRFGHLKRLRQDGRCSTVVRQPGRRYVGFMMYDDGSDQRIAVFLNDEFKGLAIAHEGNRRFWLYYLSDPVDLKPGDRITLQAAGGSGNHGVCNLLFFPEAPQTRQVEFKVENTCSSVPVGADGEVMVSWTTTWPSDSKFEYGPTKDYGQVATEECHRLVHRAHLRGLKPGVTYHGRGVGTDRDGQPYHGPDFTFKADPPPPTATIAGVHRVPLEIKPVPEKPVKGWAVTQGLPFPRGVLGNLDNVRLTRGGQEVPAQLKITGRWPEGSIKWILVTLLADLPATGDNAYVMEYGADVKRSPDGPALAVARAGGVEVQTGALSFSIDSHGRFTNVRDAAGKLLAPLACETSLVTEGGTVYRLDDPKATVEIEEAGPSRCLIRTTGRLLDAEGNACFQIEQRLEAYRGQAYVRVHHTFLNDRPEPWTNLERLTWHLPLAGEWQAALAEGGPVKLTAEPITQRFDTAVVQGGAQRDARLVGTVLGGPGGAGVALKDGWQNYPIGLSADQDGLDLDLCADFEPGVYDEFPFEKEGHHLYFYLLNGVYRFKQGMAKTHDLFLSFTSPEQSATNVALFQQPPLLVAPPSWYCDSQVFYNVAPRDTVKFKAYEEAIDANLKSYVEGRERQHDYGLMNYGDWYGERGANWGNIEYDTQSAFLLEFIRSGNPEAFYLADATELHNRDVDTVHWAPNPHNVGAVYVHQMGHVGGYYDKSVPGTLGIPRAGYTVSHAWTEGHFGHYFLTGDPRSLQTGRAVADYFADKMLSSPYDWDTCRVPGWHLIMNVPALAATGDPYYLNVSKVIVNRVLETQDVDPRPLPAYQCEPGRTTQVGGWSRMMVPGHCTCEPRHQGNAGFMVAILLSGLEYYYDVTGEEAVKQAILRGAKYLLTETYSDEIHGFRYTSCPNTGYRGGASPLMVEAVARAYRWTGDEQFKDVLTNGLALGARGAGYGKSFSMYYRCAPRVLAELAAAGLSLEERQVTATAPFKAPDWLTALPADRKVLLQAEAFTGQGGGTCQIRDDRQATFGKMITYWHQDVGHWLSWDFDAPADGKYKVIFRYATSSTETARKFELDGKVPAPCAESIAFPSTGGFGFAPSDWHYQTLGADDQPLLLNLTKGRHTIRMTNLKDGLGMDFLVLVRE